MKTILAALLAMAIVGGLAGQASAAASTSTPGTAGSAAPFSLAEAEYDFPAFGTQQWWQLQEDRG
jgi:hypothetical protein